MNSRNPLAKGYKSPLFKHNETYWQPFLMEAIQYLKGLKLADEQPLCNSVRKTGPVGFIASSISIMHLFDSNVKAGLHTLRYLLTYKPSQGHLELLQLFAVVGFQQQQQPFRLQPYILGTQDSSNLMHKW